MTLIVRKKYYFLDENFTVEQRVLDKIIDEFNQYVETFEDFLYTDHTNSMFLLRQSEREALIATDKYEEYRKLSKEYGALKSWVYNLEEQWRQCKLYQKFLYLVSPMEWRKQYDFYMTKHTSMDSIELNRVFSRFRLASTGDILTIENLIEQFLEDVKVQGEPVLYFKEPKQLIKVYHFIEIQNLNSLLHLEELAQPLELVKVGMELARNRFDEEMASLKEIVDSLEGGIL